MRFERLRTTESPEYPEAMELYKLSFPFHEQREAASQARIMGHEEYQFNRIKQKDEWVGLMLCWETEDFVYVEHFCILPAMRNKGYGEKALRLLTRRGKPVILEIDPPVDEISMRRKGFYERAEFNPNRWEHEHPAYHAGFSAHRLVVMSYPDVLSGEQYQEFARYLKAVVMGC